MPGPSCELTSSTSENYRPNLDYYICLHIAILHCRRSPTRAACGCRDSVPPIERRRPFIRGCQLGLCRHASEIRLLILVSVAFAATIAGPAPAGPAPAGPAPAPPPEPVEHTRRWRMPTRTVPAHRCLHDTSELQPRSFIIQRLDSAIEQLDHLVQLENERGACSAFFFEMSHGSDCLLPDQDPV